MMGVFWIEGGILQSFELYPTEAEAIKRAAEWAKERGMQAESCETFEPETGSYHDDETDIFIMEPENALHQS